MSTGDHWQFFINDVGQRICRYCGKTFCEHQGIGGLFPYGGKVHTTPQCAVEYLLTGWECPKCHRVWGPQVTECEHCNKREE